MVLLRENSIQFKWIGVAPEYKTKVALLVPQYNEASNFKIEGRLNYFKNIAARFRDEIDVIIIDDGSTDSSLEEIKLFLSSNNNAFYLASVSPNSNKVGALYLTVQEINYDFLILSDFDTDIHGYNKIIHSLDSLYEDQLTMGFYFRMLPFEGDGHIFDFQQLEYSIQRSLYKIYEKEGSVPVMPGAGACYRRSELLSIYQQHSGLRSGEDREATMIGLKLGYKTFYVGDVLSLTRPPLSIKTLIKQRVRWNLGYLETSYKEYKYYARNVGRFTRIGIIFLADLIIAMFMVLFPAIVISIALLRLNFLLYFLLGTYLFGVIFCLIAILISPKEFIEIRKKLFSSMFLFPIFKLGIGHLSWAKAIKIFFRKRIESIGAKRKQVRK
jgi:cellulose synthase/poly-beta-1,6-N-acetylglucosamine synthase-like glycosyltransferase